MFNLKHILVYMNADWEKYLSSVIIQFSSDAIQPSHPLLSLSPPAPNPSQHQGLLQGVNSLHEVAKVLKFQLQHQSLQ